ncbi:MAG: FtsW/RodA/SpoVE family cell cycle protein [Acidimicrobiia bacterium]
MNRDTEAALLAAAVILAAFGVTLVNLAQDGNIGIEAAWTLLLFLAAFTTIHLGIRRWAPHANPYLFPLAGFLTAIGFVEVYRVDPALGTAQRWWLLTAAAAAAGVLFLLRQRGVAILRRYRYLFLAAAILLLLLPLLPGSWPLYGAEVGGSRLWVQLRLPASGELSFQPGEAAKLLLVVFLASYLAERHPALTSVRRRLGPIGIPEPRQLLPLLVAWGASFAVLIYQRDLGASLLLFVLFVTLLYSATGRPSYLGAGGLLVATGGLVAYRLFDHVQTRVFAWLHPFDDYTGAGYQIAQGLFALGSGSLTGSGLGMGRPDLIPAAATDFVFAAVAEEAGLAGAVAVVAAFALLVAAGLGIALRVGDRFRKLLAAGLTLVIAIQTLLILAGVIRLLPVTGITLPFMSYGGSSLLANMVLLALLARISHEERS